MQALLSYNALDSILNYTIEYATVAGTSYDVETSEEETDRAFGISTNICVCVMLIIAAMVNMKL